MANRLFSNGREKVMNGTINLDTSDLRAVLVASTYTFNVDDEFMTSIGANDNGRSATLANTTVLGSGANSTLDADDTSLVAKSDLPGLKEFEPQLDKFAAHAVSISERERLSKINSEEEELITILLLAA